MKAKVAVVTLDGKAYFQLVNELKERDIDFLSLVPGETVPAEAKVVITTEIEKPQISFNKILVYDNTSEPNVVVSEAIKILQGKDAYDKIVIGIDPGEVTGLAVVGDGKVNQSKVCLSTHEIVTEVKAMTENVDFSATQVLVKIGNGIPLYKELLTELDTVLSSEVVLELVSEAGTDRLGRKDKHRRGLRDIASAIRIAGREGRVYPRGRAEEK